MTPCLDSACSFSLCSISMPLVLIKLIKYIIHSRLLFQPCTVKDQPSRHYSSSILTLIWINNIQRRYHDMISILGLVYQVMIGNYIVGWFIQKLCQNWGTPWSIMDINVMIILQGHICWLYFHNTYAALSNQIIASLDENIWSS